MNFVGIQSNRDRMIAPCNVGGSMSMSSSRDPEFETLKYERKGPVAYISLNRPERLNAISMEMPLEIRNAVNHANHDDSVSVIVLQGNGRAFCSGYDLKEYAEKPRGEAIGSQKMPWDPFIDYKMMHSCTLCFKQLFESYKPTIAKVHGFAVAGGSDIALCCDIVIMADDAKIGYPPARVWGTPTTAMWAYRVGPEKAKRMLFTGDVISGTEAASMGLVLKSVPASMLDAEVDKLVSRIASVPSNQLFFQKQVINSMIEPTLGNAQRLATLFDGMSRHSPEGVEFHNTAMKHGFHRAVQLRDNQTLPAASDASDVLLQSRL